MPLLALPHCMIGRSPAALALASRSSNSATRLGRLGHADLRGQLLVVEDAGQAVVEAHGIERAGAAGAVLGDAVLVELGRRPLVPAESGGVVVEVLEQPVLGERDHRRQPDQVGRVVAREQARRRGDQVRELVLLDVPGHVRELLGELLGQLEGDVEAGLEVGVEHDRIRPAAWARGCRSFGRLLRWALLLQRAAVGGEPA